MESLANIRIDDAWLKQKSLQRLFDILLSNGGEAMVIGGAVRNSLMKRPVNDVDLATNLQPDEIVSRLEEADERAIPTGIDHGTVTALIDKTTYEITTLREDIATDGRHASVRFGTDWVQDAQRRDFTINALYCDRVGNVFDPVDGIDDIAKGEVRFIGDPATRIREDALRILRFFRFFAWYGSGRPDAASLKACAALRDLLGKLSAERVWAEMKKLLSAADPGRALLWMRTSGILGTILPESEKWGIDAIPALLGLEQDHEWDPDPMLRLMAMIPPSSEIVVALSKRFAMSNAEHSRLVDWANSPLPDTSMSPEDIEQFFYRNSHQGTVDALRVKIAHIAEDEVKSGLLSKFLKQAQDWKRPDFPLKGRDLLSAGHEPGPEMGALLNRLEEAWIESNFKLTHEELLAKALN